MYDPNFQQQSLKSAVKGMGKGSKGAGASVEGKLEQIRVKKLKFTLKESGYENAQDALLSSEPKHANTALKLSKATKKEGPHNGHSQFVANEMIAMHHERSPGQGSESQSLSACLSDVRACVPAPVIFSILTLGGCWIAHRDITQSLRA